MKIVIITRVIYPTISPRSFRSTELAKEFARIGHNVFLYNVIGKFNYSEFEKKYNITVKNIGKMRFATTSSDGTSRYNLLDKITYHTLHKHIEFPDIELTFKVYNLLRKENNIDILITIAYPHTIHWGAALFKIFEKRSNQPKLWISDCGDPYWGDTANIKKNFYFKYIEKWWCKLTDYITIPNNEGKDGYLKEAHEKIKIIPQGFNIDNININTNHKKNEIPTFAFAGSIYLQYRDPSSFLKYLTTIKRNFKFIIYTNNPNFFIKYKDLLKHKIEIRAYIERNRLIYELSEMDFIINFKNNTNIQKPSKLIDYYLSQSPILEISSKFDNKNEFEEFLNANYRARLIQEDISQYDIKNIAKMFLELYTHENKQ